MAKNKLVKKGQKALKEVKAAAENVVEDVIDNVTRKAKKMH
jgi:hypothetical protein